MAQFGYIANDKTGAKRSGSIEAIDKRAATSQIQAMGLKNIMIRDTKIKTGSAAKKTSLLSNFYYLDDKGAIQLKLGEDIPSTKELAVFTKQFSIMIERGIPIVQVLEILSDQQRSYDFRKTIRNVRVDVENGVSLHQALNKHPKVFDSLFVTLIEAGEVSGQLDTILKQLTRYIERISKLKTQIKKALTYPTAVILTAVGVVIFLLMVVVPQIAQQFSSSGNELPWLTQVVLDASEIISSYSVHLAAATILFGFALKFWASTPDGQLNFHRLLLKTPIIGAIVQKISVSRMCATMSTLLNAGVPILDALKISASASGNRVIEVQMNSVRDLVSKGSSLSQPLTNSPIFPKMVVSMIAIGEQTGALDETLSKVNEIYEDEVDTSVSAMTSLIEPALLVFLGLSVGVILVAMYLPLWSMSNNMG